MKSFTPEKWFKLKKRPKYNKSFMSLTDGHFLEEVLDDQYSFPALEYFNNVKQLVTEIAYNQVRD